jgi:hypothetical protein
MKNDRVRERDGEEGSGRKDGRTSDPDAVTAPPGCGAVIPDTGAKPNPEVNASPGCWAAYGDVLGREYGEWGNPPIHRLTADTYAVQHPGAKSRRAAQSLAVHLLGLYLALDRRVEPHRISQEIGRLVAHPTAFRWLEPPSPEGQVTIVDVRGADTLREHNARVHRWALSVWEAWSDHHETVRRWAGG